MDISTRPGLTRDERHWSHVAWLFVLGVFLYFELLGARDDTPWKTLSETSWDLEQRHPVMRPLYFGFLIGLATHIRFKTRFFHSVAGGVSMSESARIFWGV